HHQPRPGRRPDRRRRRPRHQQRPLRAHDLRPRLRPASDHELRRIPPPRRPRHASHAPAAHGNPLAVKGTGEGGTIPSLAAVVSAIEDALFDYGVTVNEYPLSPERIVELME